MVSEYTIERNSATGQAKIVIPALIRDSVYWKDATKVIVEHSEDSDGPYMRLRPVVV